MRSIAIDRRGKGKGERKYVVEYPVEQMLVMIRGIRRASCSTVVLRASQPCFARLHFVILRDDHPTAAASAIRESLQQIDELAARAARAASLV